MQTLWGDFLPVPENKLHVANDGEGIHIGSAEFIPHNTPGHAEHHFAYQLEDTFFCGDVGGVRIPGYQYLRVPMPPPELNLEKWKQSIARLRKEKFSRIAPTHFGIYDDVDWQLDEMEKGLDSAARWMEQVMPSEPPIEELRASFTNWVMDEGRAVGLSEDVVKAYELANPLGMSADGLLRYWKKAVSQK